MEAIKNTLNDLVDGLVSDEVEARLQRVDPRLNEFGVDPFGFDPTYVKPAMIFLRFLYERWFRVQTFGMHNVPEGRVMLIGNHSGQVPLDAMMIGAAMFLEAEPPRIVRSMIEKWVPSLPFVSYLFQRWGQIVGTRENCLRLFEAEQSILVFPEGMRGISKPYSKRYQLQDFGLGFMRLALMSDTPIVPVAVVGAEEQAPQLYNFKPVAKLFGLPALPITPTFPFLGPLGMLPYPSRYRIYFGKPMFFEGNPDDEDSVMAEKVNQVKQTISRMLRDGLKAREHVFW